MDYRKMFKPISRLYVPSGWCIEKNHVFNLNADGFLKIKDEKTLFLAREYFISECVFYAKSELHISTTESFLGVIDIGCKLIDEGDFLLRYDVSFWLYHKKKKDNIIFDSKYEAKNPNDALDLVSILMKNLSHGELKIEGYNLAVR